MNTLYPLKTGDGYNTEKDSSTVKDPTSHTLEHRSHVTVLRNVSEPLSRIFLSRIFLPTLFGSDSQNFSVAKILRRTVYCLRVVLGSRPYFCLHFYKLTSSLGRNFCWAMTSACKNGGRNRVGNARLSAREELRELLRMWSSTECGIVYIMDMSDMRHACSNHVQPTPCSANFMPKDFQEL